MDEGEHLNDRYIRYHADIYMPERILTATLDFLPPAGYSLPLSRHYGELQKGRFLPVTLNMPDDFDIVDTAVIRATQAIFRVCIRFAWPSTKLLDLVLILEGDHEVVSGYWNARDDRHQSLDIDRYVQSPAQAEFDEARP